MDANPYAAPVAELHGTGATLSGEVDATLVEVLARTKPWLRVVGVFLWIGVGFMVLAGIFMLGAGAVGGLASMQQKGGSLSGPMMMGMSVFYVVLAALYVIPARRLWSAGSAIERLVHSRMRRDLAAALEAQRSFWKFVGVGFLCIACVYVLFLLGAVIFGIAGIAGRPPAP